MIATVHVTPECVENAIFERGAESKSRGGDQLAILPSVVSNKVFLDMMRGKLGSPVIGGVRFAPNVIGGVRFAPNCKQRVRDWIGNELKIASAVLHFSVRRRPNVRQHVERIEL